MSLKILLADDSMTAQNMGKKILMDAGYDVVAVSNGAQAVKKIAEHKPDIAILDIYMPGYTGLEVCERVKGNLESSRTPVLLTVGKMEPYRPEDGSRVRADGVIVKPFEASDLLAAIEKLADKLKPAPPVPDYDQTIVIPPPTAADFNDATFQEWKQVAENTTPERIQVPQEMQVSPAIGLDELGIEPVNSEIGADPSFVSGAPLVMESLPTTDEALSGFSGFADLADEPLFALESAPEPAATESTSLVESFEVEFNAPPDNIEVEAEPLPGLETNVISGLGAVEAPTDPALVNSVELASAFPTSFGVENAEDVPVGIVEHAESDTEVAPDIAPEHELLAAGAGAAIEPAPVQDDFEARVAAAMAAYDPATAAAPLQEWRAEEAPVDPVEAAVSLEAEMAQASTSHSAQLATPDIAAVAEVEHANVMVAEHPSPDPAIESIPAEIAEPLLEPSPSLVSPFEAAVSASQIDNDVAAAMAEAISDEPAEAAPLEDATALAAAAAVGAATLQPHAATLGEDRIASAIQRVLERFKPQLVSEIARELASEDQEDK